MRLAEAIEVLAKEVDRLDPARTSGADASRLIAFFERGERLCAAGKALMTARAVETRQWARDGAHSPQEWLSQLSGVPVGTAQRSLETAERVVAQPELADAMRSGELSSAQAAEISSAVAENPAATPRLLREAKKQGFKGLKQQCRAARLAAASSREDDEAVARRQRESRYLRMWSDADGSGRIDARLDPVSFTTFTSMFRPFEDEAFDAARKNSVREPLERYRADALVALAQAAAGGTGRDGPKRRAPAQVVVHVSREALLRGYLLEGETCEIEGFGPVPVAVARMIMEDGFLAAVVTDGTDIRRVVHLGRHPTAMQRTALSVRDRCCVVPKCGQTERLQTHHAPPFEETRHTTVDELALLCPKHHDDVTHHGAILSGGPGNWQWTPPPPHGEFEGPPEGMDPCAGPFDGDFPELFDESDSPDDPDPPHDPDPP